MTLVEVDPVDDPLHGLVERGVVEDHVRRLAAELERQFLAGAGELRLIALPTSVEPVKAILSTSLLTSAAPARPSPVMMLTNPRRELGLTEHIAESSAERGRLGRLEHDGVPCRERRRDLPGKHQEREVPRDDLLGDAERLWLPVRERVLELVCPAGVVEEVSGREGTSTSRDSRIGLPPFSDSSTANSRALLEDARDPVEVLRSLGTGQRRPAVLKSAAGRLDRKLHLFLGRLANLGERLLGRRADRRVGLLRLEPLAADEVTVALAKGDDVARLGRGLVLPTDRNGRLVLLSLELSQS